MNSLRLRPAIIKRNYTKLKQWLLTALPQNWWKSDGKQRDVEKQPENMCSFSHESFVPKISQVKTRKWHCVLSLVFDQWSCRLHDTATQLTTVIWYIRQSLNKNVFEFLGANYWVSTMSYHKHKFRVSDCVDSLLSVWMWKSKQKKINYLLWFSFIPCHYCTIAKRNILLNTTQSNILSDKSESQLILAHLHFGLKYFRLFSR